MHAVALAMALAASPFWETRPVGEWTDAQLRELLTDSPWARVAQAERRGGVRTYLASALPIREAEAELRRRGKRTDEGDVDDDYREFIKEDNGKSIILVIEMRDWQALADARESKMMEEECVMKIGRKKHKITGHFPPTPSDPYLRLVFPRVPEIRGKVVSFELYLPGVDSPFREAEYTVKEMTFRGRLEM